MNRTFLNNSKNVLTVLGLLSLIVVGCGPGGGSGGGSGGQDPHFRTFADHLEANLKNKSVGYSFSVSYKDQWVDARVGGEARTSADPPAFPMDAEVRFSTASLSKTITAAAALQLLLPDKGTSFLDQNISSYLPSEFRPDIPFQTITFRQLLQHKSGIGTATDLHGNPIDARDVDYQSLVNYVSSHPNVSNKAYHYSNTNYALFRFLIPALAHIPIHGDQARAYADAYMRYVQQNVFDPVGLYRMSADSDASTGFNYHFPLPAPPYHGMDLGDLTLKIASQGWVMSTQGLAHFLRDLHYTENILPASAAKQMKDDCLGYDACGMPVSNGSHYLYSAKGGFYPGCGYGNAGEFAGALAVFSNDLSVAVIVNSNLAYRSSADTCRYQDSPNNPMTAVLDAFDTTFGR